MSLLLSRYHVPSKDNLIARWTFLKLLLNPSKLMKDAQTLFTSDHSSYGSTVDI